MLYLGEEEDGKSPKEADNVTCIVRPCNKHKTCFLMFFSCLFATLLLIK